MTEKRKIAALKQAVYYRNYRRARDSALVKLSQLYPADYRRLLEEEKRRYEAEGKVWVDITGRTNASVGAPTGNGEPDQVTNGLGNQGKAG
jgi:hypothetical protein